MMGSRQRVVMKRLGGVTMISEGFDGRSLCIRQCSFGTESQKSFENLQGVTYG